MTQKTSSEPRKSPRWVRVLLFVSLAFNLLIVGIVAGFVAKGGPGGPRERSGEMSSRMPYVAALEKKDRRALGRELGRKLRAGHSDQESRKAQLEQGVALLQADPFDAQAFVAHIQQSYTRGPRRDVMGPQMLADFVAQMSDADRAAYVVRLEQVIARGPGKRHSKP